MVATVATVAYLGLEARAVEVQVQLVVRPAGLRHRRPARQGGRRKPRAGARGACGDRPGAAAQAHHRQPVAGRPAQGRARISTCRSRLACWRRWACRRRKPVALCRGRRTRPRRADRRRRPGVLLAALHASAIGKGLICPAAQGRGGGLGGRCRSHRRARPAGAAHAFQGHALLRRPRRARRMPPGGGPDLARSRARRSPSARSRSQRRAGIIC